jgi:hypothetical protein
LNEPIYVFVSADFLVVDTIASLLFLFPTLSKPKIDGMEQVEQRESHCLWSTIKTANSGLQSYCLPLGISLLLL